MSKKNIVIIAAVIIIMGGGYYLTTTAWFTLWRTSEPQNLSPAEVERLYGQYLDEGLKKESEQNYLGAILAYKQANKIAPGAIPPKNNIAEACIILGDYNCAEEWFLKIIKKEYNPATVVKLSNLYKDKMGETQKAIDILRSAYEFAPNYLNFVYQLGFLYKEIGDTKQAKEYLTKASLLSPDDQNIKDLLQELNR